VSTFVLKDAAYEIGLFTKITFTVTSPTQYRVAIVFN